MIIRFARLARVAIVLPFAFAACVFSMGGALADPLDTPTPTPEWTKTIGTLRVQKFGSGEPALILVPGLACGPWVYRDTIAHEAARHTIYAVTLAGFDGVPFDAAADTLDAADASIATLVAQESIVKPILVGHSLGGFLALRFGIEHPDLLRAIVSIDGLPVLPTLAEDTPKQLHAYANGFASEIGSASQASFEKHMLAFTRDFVTSPAIALQVAKLTDRSDRAAVAAYGKALYLADLRPQIQNLTVPTLLMAPVPALPLPSFYPVQMTRGDAQGRERDVLDVYGRIMGGAQHLTIAPVRDSRHYVMLDRPKAYFALLDEFIAAH